MIVLQILLVVSTIVSPMVLNFLGGYGLIVQAKDNLNEYPDMIAYQQDLMNLMVTYGKTMIASSVLMVLAMMLCLCKFNVVPVVLQSTGFTICMVIMFKISAIADKYGLSDSNMQPLSEKYFNRHIITIVPLVLLITICVVRHFSYENRIKRKQKRLKKYEEENAPCEKIID